MGCAMISDKQEKDNARKKSQTTRRLLVFLPLLLLVFGLVIYSYYNFPFTSGVIASMTDGDTDLCVVQVFKGYEPYQVCFLVRKAGSGWREYYLAHQDSRWRSCRIAVDSSRQVATVYRGDLEVQQFDLQPEVKQVSGWHKGDFYLDGNLSQEAVVEALKEHYCKL